MSDEIINNPFEAKTEPTETQAPAAPVQTGTEVQEKSFDRPRRPPRREGGDDGGESSGRPPRFRKKVCRFCQDKNNSIDYKRADILDHYITERGKILPRRVTGTCSKHQRTVAREIKKARIIALLPFVEK
jgi:small subunit ribosomal protein S18